MTLHIPATPGAAIACDMSTAVDTPEERLRSYARWFDRALLRRERREDDVRLVFRADERTLAAIEELARREAACCPFLDLRVETAGDEVTWTLANAVTGPDRAAADAILDAFYALEVPMGEAR